MEHYPSSNVLNEKISSVPVRLSAPTARHIPEEHDVSTQ
jgi:hypothetical protein